MVEQFNSLARERAVRLSHPFVRTILKAASMKASFVKELFKGIYLPPLLDNYCYITYVILLVKTFFKKAKELERRGEESGIRRKNVIEMVTYSIIFLIYEKLIMHLE